MYSVYFVVSEHSLSDRIRSVIDFPRFDLQYFGTEYHSALTLRLAIVAKPQIIVLDSDAPFISVSKFVSMLRENDVNCVLILLEGSDARHEPCPGIAAIRLDRNDLSPQRVQDAFRHAIAMADSRSAIRLTISSPHQMPDDLLAYLQSGGPLTPARLALLFPRTQWVNYYLTVLVFQTPVSDRQLQSFFSSCTARLLFPFYLCRVSETELLLLASKHVLPLLTGVVREIWPGAAHTFLSDYATEPPQLPQATLQLLNTPPAAAITASGIRRSQRRISPSTRKRCCPTTWTFSSATSCMPCFTMTCLASARSCTTCFSRASPIRSAWRLRSRCWIASPS